MTADKRLVAARFVATYWRDGFIEMEGYARVCAHPLSMVLAALDGETDPLQLGIDAGQREAFLAAVSDESEVPA